MKTQPITIEPGSGTKLAGKTVRSTTHGFTTYDILFVSEESLLAKSSDGKEERLNVKYANWLEVLPDDQPEPKLSYELFFDEFGNCDLQFFDPELSKYNGRTRRIKTEELYQVLKKSLIAELGIKEHNHREAELPKTIGCDHCKKDTFLFYMRHKTHGDIYNNNLFRLCAECAGRHDGEFTLPGMD